MFSEGRSADYTPITVIGRFPIYLTELLIILHVAALLVGALLGSTAKWAAFLVFQPDLVLGNFQIWRLVSYIFVNDPGIWFVLGMAMLWWFGREVEKFYGRRNYLIGYCALTVIPALLALIPPLNLFMAGPGLVHFGIFLIFASTYPGVAIFYSVLAKWVAWILLAIYSLWHLKNRSVPGFVNLWVVAGTAYGLTRFWGRGAWLPESWNIRLPAFWQQPKFRVLKSPSSKIPSPASAPRRVSAPASSASPASSDDPISSIDPILDKIARRGIDSLTPRERAALEAASGALQRKESGKS